MERFNNNFMGVEGGSKIDKIQDAVGDRLMEGVNYLPNAATAVVGGIMDATARNAMSVLDETVNLLALRPRKVLQEGAGRLGKSVEHAVKLQPGKAAAQLIMGAEQIAEQAVETAADITKIGLNTVTRGMRGTARAVAGVLGEDIKAAGDLYAGAKVNYEMGKFYDLDKVGETGA